MAEDTTDDLLNPKVVDWILFSLPELRAAVERIQAGTGPDIIPFMGKRQRTGKSRVEKVAIDRAVISEVLDAAEKAVRRLPTAEIRQVYRLKYRRGLSTRQIAKKLHYSSTWVQDRVEQVRDYVRLYLVHVSGVAHKLRGVLRE